MRHKPAYPKPKARMLVADDVFSRPFVVPGLFRALAPILWAALAALLLMTVVLASPPARAATTYTVTNTNDSGAGSLRQAILDANAKPDDETIEVDATGTIDLQGPLPPLSTDMTINGPGADELTVRRDGGGEYGIFVIPSGATVSISGLTISGGYALASGAPAPPGGGGVYNLGTLSLTDSTISGNHTDNYGGGILNSWQDATHYGVAELRDVTVTDNSTAFMGAGS